MYGQIFIVMKKLILIIIIFGLCSFSLCAQLKYPSTPKVEVNDTLWGTIYKDNYRWLENMKAPEVISWFKQQAELTDSVLQTISGRNELVAEWYKLLRLIPPDYSSVVEAGGKFFFQKRNPGENVGKVYYRENLNGEDQLLFDPMSFIAGKTLTVESIVPSLDGKKLLIGYSEQGAEITTLRVMDVQTKQLLSDVVPSTLFSAQWSFDNLSFLYTWIRSIDNTDPDAFLNPKIKRHKLGTDTTSDIDFFSNESYPSLNIDASMYPYVYLSEYARDYIFAGEGSVQAEMKMYYASIDQFNTENIKWSALCTLEDKLVRNGIEVFDDKIYAITYRDAKNYQLIATNLKKPDWSHAETVVAEKSMVLEDFVRCKDYIMLKYSDGIINYLYKYNPKTKETSEIELPIKGSSNIRRLDSGSNNYLVGIKSGNHPFTEFVLNAETDLFSASPFNQPTVYPEEYRDLVEEEVEVKGHDGVMVPLSIIYKKGIKKDGSNVCLMDGYGAYGANNDTYIERGYNSLAVKGVIIAITHVRGGGEKGDAWYKAGFKTNKPNTWKDFISCAEYLIDQGFTSPHKLAGTGTSAGGVMISRAITERPDLFTGVVCNVGVANAMRFEFSANGPDNIPEFGTVKDSIESKALYEMDGMQHVKKGVAYPAVMCVAGWNDLRVVPWQPAKFAAALQNSSSSEKPVLIKVNYDNGHFTQDMEVTMANFADQYAFLMWQCGHPDFQVKVEQRGKD